MRRAQNVIRPDVLRADPMRLPSGCGHATAVVGPQALSLCSRARLSERTGPNPGPVCRIHHAHSRGFVDSKCCRFEMLWICRFETFEQTIDSSMKI